MIEQQKVYRIKNLDSLLGFLRGDLCWELPEASIDDVSFEWTGLDLNLSEDVNKKLKDGFIRQLQPFATHQPWGIFVVEFVTRGVSIITLRQILRCFVAKRRGARPDLPAWQCRNLLFICLYGENGFTFAHFKGGKPYSSRLATFSWHPGEPIRTVCEFNLPALVYDYTWTPETWVEEWQKAFDVEKVNKDFYRQIARFYYRLTGKEGQKREIVLPYVGDDSGSISIYEEFAVRLIGRTVFCWFLKHKKSKDDLPLIPPEALSLVAAQETEDFYHSVLEPLFFEVMNKPLKDRKSLPVPRSQIIPFLNGGLFEPHPNDFYTGVANYGLKIPATWFVDFFSLLEKYNFTVTENSSIDVDVAVDPEMLGRIFENLLAEVVPETGETARKATGSYYTPRAIVDYMVEQSLRQYLLTKTALAEKKVNQLLVYGEDIEDFSPAEKLATVTALKEIKVIDPACGSGAFPMGILHRMLAVLEKVDPRLELWRAQYLKSLDGIVRQTVEKNISRENWAYIRKMMIIRDSIYGVDIQPIAVEITKLRCFLSLVVDEIVLDTEKNRGIESLPNLEFKFIAANTLIGLPETASQTAFGITETIEKLKELRECYLRSFGSEKVQIEKEFRATQQKLFQENVKWLLTDAQARQLADWDPFSYQASTWFDPNWMFGIEDGFDIVIANPPYIRQEKLKDIKPRLREHYDCYEGTADIFVYFYERGVRILKEDGILTFISSNKYFRSGYGEKLRAFLTSNCRILQIIDFGDAPVFEAISYPSIIILQKTLSQKNETQVFTWQPGKALDDFSSIVHSSSSPLPQIELEADGWRLESPTILRLLEKLRAVGKPLGEYIDRKFYRGILTGLNEAFVVDRATRDRLIAEHRSSAEVLKPFLRGKDVKRWTVNFNEQYLIKIESSENMDHPWSGKSTSEKIFARTYPAIYSHLESYRKRLIKRQDQGTHFWELRSCKYWKEFEHPKIVYPNICKRNEFAWDDKGYYTNQKAFIIPNASKYLLGILNSTVVTWLFDKLLAKLQNGFYEPSAIFIKDFPIPVTTKSEAIETAVNEILSAKPKNPKSDFSVLERQIDQMVYELYGLTEDEIAVVEGELK